MLLVLLLLMGNVMSDNQHKTFKLNNNNVSVEFSYL